MRKIFDTTIRAWRYNPQTGRAESMGEFDNTGVKSLSAPWGQDWVIVLDDASKNYAPPGVPLLQPR